MARAEGTRKRSSDRGSGARHGLAILLLLVLPGFMFVGILAPAAVQVQERVQTQTADTSSEPLHFRPLSKRPLPVPRDFSAGFVPELVDIESLFIAAPYRAPDWQRISSLPSFPSRRGDTIVLDEVDAYVAQEVFDDALEPGLRVDLTPLWDPAVFDVIPPPLSRNGERQYDDFGGGGTTPVLASPPPVVPEPQTAVLLAFGLLALAIARRWRH